MQQGKPIVLPLAVGLSATAKPPLQTLSTGDVEIELSVKCKLLKSLYCQSCSKLSLRDVSYEGERMLVDCSDVSKGEFDRQIQLHDNSKEDHIVLPPFRGVFRKQKDGLVLSLTKTLTNFLLFPAGKTRFVKNQQLERVIEQRLEEWGPLSMDKSERIMLEPRGTTFPVIGLWVSTRQPMNHAANLVKLVNYLHEKSPKKCTFSAQGRSFFYLVRIDADRSVPQLFLVEWQSQGETEKSIPISKKDAFTMGEIVVGSEQQSPLQFTLRSDEKVPEPLLNIACSPIKFPSSPQEATRSTLPDSPRFRLDHSALAEQECASLRRLAREQEIEINDLRAEVLRLTGELRQCRRHRHCWESQEDLSLASDRNGPERGRRLTRSDLNYDQPSVANEESQERVQGKGQERVLQAWERFQIEQPIAQ